MQSVGSRHTGPELAVRSLVHRLGYRFRLHGRDLPGKPDLVFAGRRKVVFVHGCFWHGHRCRKAKVPKSNVAFWRDKMRNNRARDWRNLKALEKLGWGSLVLWQCELKDISTIRRRILAFLG